MLGFRQQLNFCGRSGAPQQGYYASGGVLGPVKRAMRPATAHISSPNDHKVALPARSYQGLLKSLGIAPEMVMLIARIQAPPKKHSRGKYAESSRMPSGPTNFSSTRT